MRMKKIRLLLVAALVVVVALFVAYRIVNRAPAEELPLEARVLAIMEDGGCLSCHSAEPELPFYASLPVAKSVVMKDVEEGYRAYDIEPFISALRPSVNIILALEIDIGRLHIKLFKRNLHPSLYPRQP